MEYIYLSKKICVNRVSELTCARWNSFLNYLCVGGKDGFLRILELSGDNVTQSDRLSLNQTLVTHSGDVTKVCWNSPYRKMTSCDSKGKIVVFLSHANQFHEEMVNNRKRSTVKDLSWSNDGRKICIVYEDGMVILGTVDGNRIWSKTLASNLKLVEWSPDNSHLMLVTNDNKILLLDSKKGTFSDYFHVQNRGSDIKCIRWFPGITEGSCIAVGFSHGVVELFKSEEDRAPIIIETEMNLRDVKWSHSGKIFAVAGVGKNTNDNRVLFYDPSGNHITHLDVPGKGQVINEISWDKDDLRLVIVIGNNIFFAVVRAKYHHCLFRNTLTYLVPIPNRIDDAIVFWNTKSNEKHVKNVRRLVHLRANDHFLYTITRNPNVGKDESSIHTLTIMDDVGNHLNSTSFQFHPRQTRPSGEKTVLICSRYYVMVISNVCPKDRTSILSYETEEIGKFDSRGGGEENKNQFNATKHNKKGVKDDDDDDESLKIDQKLFHINQDQSRVNEIVSLEEKYPVFLVGRESGLIHVYTIFPSIQLKSQVSFKCVPSRMFLSHDCNKLGIVGVDNVLKCYVLHFDEQYKLQQVSKHLSEKKDIWDLHWNETNPNMFCVMEKDKLYVYRGTEIEEPRKSAAYILRFKSLEIEAARMDEIVLGGTRFVRRVPSLTDPVSFPPGSSKKERHYTNFKTKSVRDTKDLVDGVSLEEAYKFVLDNEDELLWKYLAKKSLEQLNLEIAKKCFIHLQDYPGLRFIHEELEQIESTHLRRALVYEYLGQFGKAERIYRKTDRLDLLLRMKKKFGDWFSILNLIEQYCPDEESEDEEDEGEEDDSSEEVPFDDYDSDDLDSDDDDDDNNNGKQRKKMKRKAIRNKKKKKKKKKKKTMFIKKKKKKKKKRSGDKMKKSLRGGSRIVEKSVTGTNNLEILLSDQNLRRKCFNEVGEYYLERFDFERAVGYYKKSRNYERMIKCYGYLGDGESLQELVDVVNDPQQLERIAKRLERLGEPPLQAYEKAGRPEKGLSFCLEYQCYDLAMDLLQRHPELVDVQSLNNRVLELSKSVTNPHQLLELFRTAKDEGSLSVVYRDLIDSKNSIIQRKKLSIKYSLDVKEMFREDVRKKLESDHAQKDKWKRAEAYHFLLLCCKQFYQGEMTQALITALRLTNYEIDVFTDMKSKERIYCLIVLFSVLCKVYKIASKYLSKLELINREKYRPFAVDLFLKHPLSSEFGSSLDFLKVRKCSNCTKSSWKYLNQCPHCQTEFLISIESGKWLSDKENIWRCRTCSHICTEVEKLNFDYCPFCHQL